MGMNDKIEIGDLVEFIGYRSNPVTKEFPLGTYMVVGFDDEEGIDPVTFKVVFGRGIITNCHPYKYNGVTVFSTHISCFRKIPHERATKDIGIKFKIKDTVR
jgi:hypothetical protein